jgi:putative toxin-antitoxin system antitoxin component (TIGR02293 family)
MTSTRTDDFLRNLPDEPTQARDALFHWLTQLDAGRDLDALIFSGAPPARPQSSTSTIGDRLAELFDVRKRQAAALLGVSESTISRNAQPSSDAIDRVYALSDLFSEVATVLGAEGARRWLVRPNPALHDASPLTLLHTRAGTRRVQQVIQALQDGNYL